MRLSRANVFVALALFLAGQVEVWGGHQLGGIGVPRSPSRTVAESVLVGITTVPLAALRQRPLTSSGLIAAALVTQVLFVTPSLSLLAGLLPLVLGTFAASAFGVPRWSWLGLVAALAVEATATLVISEERSPGEVVFGTFVLVGAWLLGAAVGQRLRRADRDVSEASRQLAAHGDAVKEIVAQERLRIARELHDVIAHGVSVMGIQASAARVLIDRDPQQAGEAMRAVEDQARESIGELQRLLGVLRDGDTTQQLEVRSGLDGLPRLLQTVGQAGLRVELTVQGSPVRLPAGPDLTAYRVIQEALTNIIKHSDATAAAVRLRWDSTGLDIEVTDQSSAPVHLGPPGHGLLGMRERVGLYGGTLTVGPLPSGGFRVVATLPTAVAVP